jgi:maleylpyruvate isomerase
MNSEARAWMNQSTELFLQALDSLADAAFDEPAGLPGWSRRHLVAHVHFNALAIGRLTQWAATGLDTPMYASREQRDAEIAEGAQRPAAELRAQARQSATAPAAALNSLDDAGWARYIVTVQGRRLPATELPWLRTREMAVHAVDLNVGLHLSDLSEDLLLALARDVLARRAVAGELAGIIGWLTGRESAPAIGPWL